MDDLPTNTDVARHLRHIKWLLVGILVCFIVMIGAMVTQLVPVLLTIFAGLLFAIFAWTAWGWARSVTRALGASLRQSSDRSG